MSTSALVRAGLVRATLIGVAAIGSVVSSCVVAETASAATPFTPMSRVDSPPAHHTQTSQASHRPSRQPIAVPSQSRVIRGVRPATGATPHRGAAVGVQSAGSASTSTNAAAATSPQGDSLSVGAVEYASLNSADNLFFCLTSPYAAAGDQMTICAMVKMNDAISGAQAPVNNQMNTSLYDACGQLVQTWQSSGWHQLGTNYMSNAQTYTDPYMPVPAGYCPGTWQATVTFQQTFTDGVTLSDTNSGTFAIVQSQATPTGGPITPPEQYGGCG